jgi:hypothetical protein
MTLCVTLGPIPASHQYLSIPNLLVNALTSIQPRVPLLADDPLERGHHALPLIPLTRNMHPTLHRNIRIRNTRREQLTQRTHIKRILRRDPPLLLEKVLHLLEHGVLQDGVDDEDEGGGYAGEEAQGSFLADQREEGGECGGRLGGHGAREQRLV